MNFCKCFSGTASLLESKSLNKSQTILTRLRQGSNPKQDSRDYGEQVLLIKLQQQDKSVKLELNAEKQHIPPQ